MPQLAHFGFGAALLLTVGCAAPRDLSQNQTPPRPEVGRVRSLRVARTQRPGKHSWLDQMMALAPSTTGTLPVRGLPMIVLTVRELRLLGADRYALPLPPRAAWNRGFSADQKRGGVEGLFLVRFGHWLRETRRAGNKDIDLMVDRAIPYRLLIETLFTGGRSGYERFHLIVQGSHGPAQIVIQLPQAMDRQPAEVSLFVAAEGVSIQVPRGHVASGCAGLGPGVTILGKGLDRRALTRCLERLVRQTPELGGARIAADRGTPFGQIVRALDAVRGVPALRRIAFVAPR